MNARSAENPHPGAVQAATSRRHGTAQRIANGEIGRSTYSSAILEGT
jgi:hypothetical protein